MKAYILSIAGVILIASVVTVIAPGGKMGQFVKGTVRLFLLTVMIAPLLTLAKGDLPEAVPSQYAEDGGYLSACAELLETRDEEAVSAYISENYGLSAQVASSRKHTANFDLEKIFVSLSFPGIIGGDERINIMTRIREDLENLYGCAAEVT